MTLALRYAARSDVGLLRDGNEDAMYAGPRLLAVADGMGGHAAGEVASRIAIECVAPLDLDPPGSDLITALRDAVEAANDYLRAMVAADSALEGMGTTLTALLWAEQRLGLVHVGDSRGYLFRDGVLSQITHDHTFVQNLVDEGRITAAEANTHPQRSWITRALDGRGEVELDLSVRESRPGDRYLLCSDGLTGVVSEDTIAETLTLPDPQQACDQLVELALRAGGPDNVTCVVADVVEADASEEHPIVGGAAADERPRPPTSDSPAARAALMSTKAAEEPAEPAADDTEPPAGSRLGRRTAIILTAVAVVLALVVLGSWLALRTQYYVGVAAGSPPTVAVFRGVNGSVLGVDLSRVDDRTDIPVAALPDYEKSRIGDGIPATSGGDARRIVERLRQEACASPTPSPAATSSSSGGTSARASGSPSPSPTRTPSSPKPSPTPSPSPLPTYCAGAS